MAASSFAPLPSLGVGGRSPTVEPVNQTSHLASKPQSALIYPILIPSLSHPYPIKPLRLPASLRNRTLSLPTLLPEVNIKASRPLCALIDIYLAASLHGPAGPPGYYMMDSSIRPIEGHTIASSSKYLNQAQGDGHVQPLPLPTSYSASYVRHARAFPEMTREHATSPSPPS